MLKAIWRIIPKLFIDAPFWLVFSIDSSVPYALVMLSSLRFSTDLISLFEIAFVLLYGFHPVIESFPQLAMHDRVLHVASTTVGTFNA